MTLAASAIDWTSVLDTLILAIPAIIGAVYAGRIHSQIKTPSGKSLGQVVEYAHDTAIANNMLLTKSNGPTMPGDHATLSAGGHEPPRIPQTEGEA